MSVLTPWLGWYRWSHRASGHPRAPQGYQQHAPCYARHIKIKTKTEYAWRTCALKGKCRAQRAAERSQAKRGVTKRSLELETTAKGNEQRHHALCDVPSKHCQCASIAVRRGRRPKPVFCAQPEAADHRQKQPTAQGPEPAHYVQSVPGPMRAAGELLSGGLSSKEAKPQPTAAKPQLTAADSSRQQPTAANSSRPFWTNSLNFSKVLRMVFDAGALLGLRCQKSWGRHLGSEQARRACLGMR